MPPIFVVPDFDHPFELHLPEYEEVFDPEEKVFKAVLVAGANFKARWVKSRAEERTLEDSVRIAAHTTKLLLALGMDIEEDTAEQEEWVKLNPPKKHKTEVHRLPDGMDPIDIFKLMHVAVRDESIVNTPKKYKLQDGLYKKIINELGEIKEIPYLDMEFDFNGKKIRSPSKLNRNKLRQPLTAGIAAVALPPNDLYTSAVGAKLSALLNEYDKQIVKDAVQLRTYITNKLIEISNCGAPKDELRALELLGKISDIGLFVEKSEVNITHTNAATLEHAIKDKINRMLGRANIDIDEGNFTPIPINVSPVSRNGTSTQET